MSISQLELGQVSDPYARRAFEQLLLRGGGRGGGGTPTPGGGDLNYVHTQGAPSATWVVTHGLGKYVAVDVVDSGGSAVIPSIHYDNANQVTLSFGSPTSGKAFVN